MSKPNVLNAAERSPFEQLRPLVLFCAATLIALSVGVAIAARALMGSFGQIESAGVHQKAEQAYRAFEADLRQLEISNRDYAEWDDAERYIRTRDSAFIAANFSANTVIAMHVDLVWIVDLNGRDLYSTLVNRSDNTAVTPAPSALLEQFRSFQTRERTLRERSPAERIVETTRGLAGVSAIEISRSDYSSPTGSVMLFARFIRAEEIQRVREMTRLPVSLALLGVPAGRTAVLPTDVTRWLENPGKHRSTYVYKQDARHINGYTAIRDLQGRPVAVFQTQLPRDIRALAWRTTWYLLSSVVALFIAFSTTIFALVLRLVKLFRRDVEHRQHAQELARDNRRNLTKQAQRDTLTGLPNRHYLHSRLPRLLNRISSSGRMLALVYLDIDHFKNINDSRGHGRGDELLQIVAKRIRAAISKHDLVARMGGDEFVIIASSMPDTEAIDRFAARVQAAIDADMMIGDKPVNITASLGVAVYPRDGLDMESLLKRADIALYQAKAAGRRCHRFFSADMDVAISEHVVLEQSLRHAIGTPQLFMEYQPIVDLRNGHMVSLEALIRWRHPEMGTIPPGRFIPVAEHSGLIIELGEQALREVLTQLRAWLDEDVPVVPIAVNVSAIQIERTDFAALVAKLAAETGVDPSWIRFEVTESAVMKEPEKLIETLAALRRGGSQILIDDFGTGYSSLSYLNRLPVDILKIDRAFVRDLGQATERSPIIHAMIDMAQRLRLKTVAEGVETHEQAMLLTEKGCDFAQGFFYSKPVPARHCRKLLEHLRRERALTESAVIRVTRGN